MAGHGPPEGLADAQSPERTEFAQDVLNSINAVTQPQQHTEAGVEMQPIGSHGTPALGVADPGIGPVGGEESTSHEQTGAGASQSNKQGSSRPTTGTAQPDAAISPAPQQTSIEDGIGPATDKPVYQHLASESGLRLVITLLLHATDTKHPYIIDEGYLQRRNVEVEDHDPANISVYTLKELIMRDWRSEWEAKPTSPSSIRLIHMGRMLEDKWNLKDARFASGPTPHIVHVTIKPQEVIDEEDARMAKGGRDGGRIGGGCRCILM